MIFTRNWDNLWELGSCSGKQTATFNNWCRNKDGVACRECIFFDESDKIYDCRIKIKGGTFVYFCNEECL